MSLASLGLRLAILDALTMRAGPAWATIAEDRIHDSRLGELRPEIDGYAPAVVVSVENRKGDSFSGQNGRGALGVNADIVFALHVLINAEVDLSDPGGPPQVETQTTIAQSDVEAEDLLDTLEAQILAALEASGWIGRFAARWLTALEAEPYRSEDGERYAVRALKISATLVEDAAAALAAFAARTATPAGLAARATTALSRLATTTAVINGDVLALEGVDAKFVKDTAPAPTPDAEKLPFRGL